MEWGRKLIEVIHSYNIELFAVQHKELTNKDLIELEAPGKDEERQEEKEVSEWVQQVESNWNDEDRKQIKLSGRVSRK